MVWNGHEPRSAEVHRDAGGAVGSHDVLAVARSGGDPPDLVRAQRQMLHATLGVTHHASVP
jgi:hypothetical protein